MTCIVALKHEKKIYVGGDRCLSDDNFLMSTTDPKIFKKDKMVIGYAGSVRMGKVLKYDFEPPKPDLRNLDFYLNIEFINSLKECFERNNLKLDSPNQEQNDTGSLIIGINGRIFEIESDWQVCEYLNDYIAIGSGAGFALGSFYSTSNLDPQDRVKLALEAADKFVTTVCQPFDYIVL